MTNISDSSQGRKEVEQTLKQITTKVTDFTTTLGLRPKRCPLDMLKELESRFSKDLDRFAELDKEVVKKLAKTICESKRQTFVKEQQEIKSKNDKQKANKIKT